MAANLHLTPTPMSKSIHTTYVKLLDPENMGIGVGILLLSCIPAEIYVISCLLPVTGRHIRITTYPDVEQYVQ